MIQFAYPELLWILPLPLLIRLLWPRARHAQGGAVWMPGAELITSRQGGEGSQGWLYLLLLWLVWAALVIAAAGPQRLGEWQNLSASGRDLMMAVDVSGSMQLQDFEIEGRQYDRMTVVKQVASAFVEARQGDRLGLVLFGDHAYLQAPLTFDNKTVAAYIREAVPGIAGRFDTAIGEAIAVSLRQLMLRPASSRVLILLSDGSNTSGLIEPLEAARLAAAEQVRIYAIGMEGATLGSGADDGATGSVDEKLLRQVAEISGGRFFRAHNTRELKQIYQQLDQLEPTQGDEARVRPLFSLAYWPLAAALLLVLLASAWRLLRAWR
ncbi:MAG: VWA domain-containing protein [Burkholderiales bacterium]|nr:MAG: VWA domain-containing protein [Burkholderiales bacterium]